MQLQLKQLRKAAGYKSMQSMADALGIKYATYKSWESGERNMSFPQACMVADLLNCSLDELAGRTEFAGIYSDNRQAVMNDDYAHLSDAGKDAAAGAVRGIRASEGARVQAAGLEDHTIPASA